MSERDRENAAASRYHGVDEQSWCPDQIVCGLSFRRGNTRASPSWALFVLCKLSTWSFRAHKSVKAQSFNLITLCQSSLNLFFHRSLRFIHFILLSFFRSIFRYFLFTWVNNEGKDVQPELFFHSNVASLFSKPAEAQGRAKFSLGSVLIRVSSDFEASQSESWAETEGRKRHCWVHFRTDYCCVLVFRRRKSLWRRNKNGRKASCDRSLPCHHRPSDHWRSIGRN